MVESTQGFLLMLGDKAFGSYGTLEEAKKAAEPYLDGSEDIVIEDSTTQPLCRHWFYERHVREWVLSE